MELATFFTPHMIAAISIIVIALFVGTLLNMIIYRVPIKLFHDWNEQCQEFTKDYKDPDSTVTKVISLKSACVQCQADIPKRRFWPIIGYLLTGGSCKKCGHLLSPRVVVIELLCVLLSICVYYRFGLTGELVAGLVFTWFLVALFFIDVDHMLLPDNIALTMLWVGLAFNTTGVFVSPKQAIVGAIIGYLMFRFVAFIFTKLRGYEGVGFGDFKMLAALGAWLGYYALPGILVIAFASNLLFRLLQMFHPQHRKDAPYPFGPFLAIGGWILLIWHTEIIQYMGTIIPALKVK